MKIITPFILTVLIGATGYFGASHEGGRLVLGAGIPYFAFGLFFIGVLWRLYDWFKSPVPFNITTTAGQQRSLSWIDSSKTENPSSRLGVIGRMLLEVFFFRSLFRNTKAGMTPGNNLGYGPEKSLWLFGLIFHYSFFFIFIRHLKFFSNPLPGFLPVMEALDTPLQLGVPALYLTDLLFLTGVTFLLARRVFLSRIKYLSLAADYFPLFLLGAIGLTGVAMRYFTHVDIMEIKTYTLSLLSFSPTLPGAEPLFFAHLLLVSILFLYFPFSKLMHAGGVFLSPTRNLRGDARALKHENPWNYPVKTHTYAEYEDDYRKAMASAGLPLEKPYVPEPPAPQEPDTEKTEE